MIFSKIAAAAGEEGLHNFALGKKYRFFKILPRLSPEVWVKKCKNADSYPKYKLCKSKVNVLARRLGKKREMKLFLPNFSSGQGDRQLDLIKSKVNR